jgi:hypothetical protein
MWTKARSLAAHRPRKRKTGSASIASLIRSPCSPAEPAQSLNALWRISIRHPYGSASVQLRPSLKTKARHARPRHRRIARKLVAHLLIVIRRPCPPTRSHPTRSSTLEIGRPGTPVSSIPALLGESLEMPALLRKGAVRAWLGGRNCSVRIPARATGPSAMPAARHEHRRPG